MKNKIEVIFFLLVMVLPVHAKKTLKFGVYEVTCEQQVNPLGIECVFPRFSWKIASQERGFLQSAYHIMVADSKEALLAGKGNCWDSGKCFSSNSILVSYAGKKLAAATRYYWQVKVWNDTGEESVWSKQGVFVTGMRHEKDWKQAQWIALERDAQEKKLYPGIHAPLVQQKIGDRKIGGYRLPMFRKKLVVEKEIEEAIVNISGLGHFDFYVNGEKVGNHFLDPGWTNYARTALYVTFDVTDLLKKKNVLGIMLGNGFYNVPRERYYKQLVSFGAPKLKLLLSLKYKDGTKKEIVTDRTWKVTEGPITYSSIYGGEDYDARKECGCWGKVDYDDESWKTPVIAKTRIELKTQLSAPLAVRNSLPVVRKYRNSKGNWIYDFGQNFSGIVHLKVKGKTGQRVEMSPGELLNVDSTVNQRASGGPYMWNYTLKGKGSEEWQPQFTYYGFRYMEVVGAADVESLELIGLHTTNSAPEAGSFSCSLPMFNKIYEFDAVIMSQAAALLGYEKDKSYFDQLALNIRKAYNQKFYNRETSQYDRNSQTANAISLYFGLVEEQDRNRVYHNLIDDITKRQYALTSGDIGYRYLLKVLEERNDADIIYQMNTKYDAPGYGWQLAYGATALTESWQAYGFVSNNHCMLGHLMEWFFSGLGGIDQQIGSVGFRKIKIKPQMPIGVNKASASYTSPYGDIKCAWERRKDFIRLDVEIPANSEAVVCLSADNPARIMESGMPLEVSKGCGLAEETEEGYIFIDITSGHYIFHIDTTEWVEP